MRRIPERRRGFAPALAVLVGLAACERPPVTPPPPPPVEGRRGPVALESCVQDRPAIAGKWYDYNPDGHTLDPKPQAWIVKDGDRYAAMRIVSIYEQDAVESGLYTLSLAVHDGTTWGPETEWITPRNVKLTGPLCADVFTQTDVGCDSDAWQIKLEVFNYFSPNSAFTVGNFGVFARSVAGRPELGDVKLALLDGVSALDALPDPSAIPELADGPATTWDTTDWAFEQFAVDLPEAGMALGTRFASTDVYWLLASRFDVVRFTVDRVEGALRFNIGSLDVEFETLSTEDVAPPSREIDVALPEPGGARYITFATETLEPAAEDLEGASYPFAPPNTKRWDLAIERVDDQTRLLVSPAACVINATQLGLDEEKMPVSTEL